MSAVEIETDIRIIREHVEGYNARNDAALTTNVRAELGGHEIIVVAEHGVPLVEIDTEDIDMGTALDQIDVTLQSFGLS